MSELHTTPENAAAVIEATTQQIVDNVGHQVKSRAFWVSNELQNSLNMVLRGARHGRQYNIPGVARMQYKKGKRVVVGYEASNYGRKGKKIWRREAGTAKIIYKKYTASAPGEPPAVRTGAFRGSWHRKTYVGAYTGYDFTVHSVTESALRVGKKGWLLGDLLDEGTENMAPRPYKQRTIDRAMPKVRKIYREPYMG